MAVNVASISFVLTSSTWLHHINRELVLNATSVQFKNNIIRPDWLSDYRNSVPLISFLCIFVLVSFSLLRFALPPAAM